MARVRNLSIAFMSVAIMCVAFVSAGCAASTVRIYRDRGNNDNQLCMNIERDVELLSTCMAAKAADKSEYEISARPGELLMAIVKCQGHDDKPSGDIGFYYPLDGSEVQPLVFGFDGAVATLNSKPVALDLGRPEAMAWLILQPHEAVKSIRSLTLSDNVEQNLVAMDWFGGQHPFIKCDDDAWLGLFDSLIAADPVGLEIGVPEELRKDHPKIAAAYKKLFSHLPSLRYLIVDPWLMQFMPEMPNLAYLSVKSAKDVGWRQIAAELPKFKSLRSLRIESPADSDFSSLAGMENLRHLSISSDAEKLNGMDKPTRLTSLAISCRNLRDISWISQLGWLEAVRLDPLPPSLANLSPLAKLPMLKLLIIGNKDNLKDARLDVVRQAKPDCKIALSGFCLGAAELVLVLLVGIAAGLVVRRVRGKASAGDGASA